jgi:hypothetical protein
VYNVGLVSESLSQASSVPAMDAFMPGLQPVGITGLYDRRTGQVLGVNFILAQKTSIIIDAARLCMREYGFKIQDDISLLNVLPMSQRVDVYGLSM